MYPVNTKLLTISFVQQKLRNNSMTVMHYNFKIKTMIVSNHCE